MDLQTVSEASGLSKGMDLSPYLDWVQKAEPVQWTGEVTEVVGMLIESRGPAVAMGDFCEIRTGSGRRFGRRSRLPRGSRFVDAARGDRRAAARRDGDCASGGQPCWRRAGAARARHRRLRPADGRRSPDPAGGPTVCTRRPSSP